MQKFFHYKKDSQNNQEDSKSNIQNEIFTQRDSYDSNGKLIKTKLDYENLNEFFNMILYMKTKSLFVGIIFIFLVNLIVTTFIYFFSANEFIVGFFYLPLHLFYILFWASIRKSQLQIKKQIYLNILSFLFFGVIFFTCYFIIFNPILSQEFKKASKCQIQSQVSQKIQGNKVEEYTLLTISFIDQDGNTQLGCGCISSRSQDNVISGFPFPYSYIENNGQISGSFQDESFTISKLKLPSWFCASNLSSISESEVKEIDNAETNIKLNECYYNHQLGYSSSNQKNVNICTQENEYPQIIFSQRPYYDEPFLNVIIALLYEPFFSFSFLWPAIMLSFVILRWKRKRNSNTVESNNSFQNIQIALSKKSLSVMPEDQFKAYLNMLNQSYLNYNKSSQNQISNVDLSIINHSASQNNASDTQNVEKNKLVNNGKKVKLDSLSQIMKTKAHQIQHIQGKNEKQEHQNQPLKTKQIKQSKKK